MDTKHTLAGEGFALGKGAMQMLAWCLLAQRRARRLLQGRPFMSTTAGTSHQPHTLLNAPPSIMPTRPHLGESFKQQQTDSCFKKCNPGDPACQHNPQLYKDDLLGGGRETEWKRYSNSPNPKKPAHFTTDLLFNQ